MTTKLLWFDWSWVDLFCHCYLIVLVFVSLFDYLFPFFRLFLTWLHPSSVTQLQGKTRTRAIYFITFVSFTVDGGLGLWSSWTACSKTCGTGTQSRSRPCNNPTPTGGGQNCTGDSSQVKSCKIKSCPGEEFLLCVCFYEGQTKCSVNVNDEKKSRVLNLYCNFALCKYLHSYY